MAELDLNMKVESTGWLWFLAISLFPVMVLADLARICDAARAELIRRRTIR
jgi:hypothetical protein